MLRDYVSGLEKVNVIVHRADRSTTVVGNFQCGLILPLVRYVVVA